MCREEDVEHPLIDFPTLLMVVASPPFLLDAMLRSSASCLLSLLLDYVIQLDKLLSCHCHLPLCPMVVDSFIVLLPHYFSMFLLCQSKTRYICCDTQKMLHAKVVEVHVTHSYHHSRFCVFPCG